MRGLLELHANCGNAYGCGGANVCLRGVIGVALKDLGESRSLEHSQLTGHRISEVREAFSFQRGQVNCQGHIEKGVEKS